MELWSEQEFWEEFFPTAFAIGPRIVPPLSRFLQPDRLDADTVRKWILQVSRSENIAPTQWAKEAGLAPSTINRFLSGKGQKSLGAATIASLGEVVRKRLFDEIDQHPEVKSSFKFSNHAFAVSVIGELVDTARGRFEWPVEDDFEIRVPLSRELIGPPSFGIRVQSADYEGIAPGSLLICLPASSIMFNPIAGQRFIAHERVDDGQVRSVLKRLVLDPGGDAWLVRTGKSDEDRAVHLGDFSQRRTFNERWLLSLAIVSTFSPETWVNFG